MSNWGIVADLDICKGDEKAVMQIRKSQKHYSIIVVFVNGMTRTIDVKASSREVAERRALKRTPGAIAVRHPYIER